MWVRVPVSERVTMMMKKMAHWDIPVLGRSQEAYVLWRDVTYPKMTVADNPLEKVIAEVLCKFRRHRRPLRGGHRAKMERQRERRPRYSRDPLARLLCDSNWERRRRMSPAKKWELMGKPNWSANTWCGFITKSEKRARLSNTILKWRYSLADANERRKACKRAFMHGDPVKEIRRTTSRSCACVNEAQSLIARSNKLLSFPFSFSRHWS